MRIYCLTCLLLTVSCGRLNHDNSSPKSQWQESKNLHCVQAATIYAQRHATPWSQDMIVDNELSKTRCRISLRYVGEHHEPCTFAYQVQKSDWTVALTEDSCMDQN